MHYFGTALMIVLAIVGTPIMGSLNQHARGIALPIFIGIAVLGFAMQIVGLLVERAKMLALDVRFHHEMQDLMMMALTARDTKNSKKITN